MRLGWAFFALAVVAAAAFALNRGVYVGSYIDTFNFGGKTAYAANCRYLFPSGIHPWFAGATGDTPQEIDNKEWFCPLFQPQRFSN
jgi:hypothetical protein